MLTPQRLGKRAYGAIENSRNSIYISAASIWEIAIKNGLGKLKAPENILAVLSESGFTELPISWQHAQAVAKLPKIHRDPFDRLLVAQTLFEQLQLVTTDKTLTRYAVPIVNPLR